ncbi:protein FAM83F [Brachionichthys hirsutus]|uniref:protein FAM83F n=1 Tax=Brachionichthys hirsutus TaxID=412623 RepID=UPI003604FE20
MAESQVTCMEDGRIGTKVPESSPGFYYSEEQRAAVEELLRNGDGAFKVRLRDDNTTDFLSAREVKVITSAFRRYGDDVSGPGAAGSDADSGVHSTYWPQMSDTEVPPLDIGWTGGGSFRGVTRVAVHTHPPKENGPHVKEVVRSLIQEATKLVAIVMDMITDPHILQDLMDAASRRSVPVYILLDNQGVPHFLDMCSRLRIGVQHLRNIRARTLQGLGFNLSFGRLPGSLCYKYMLVDGDKVMFGSYSFCWCTSRMDRNMITVMTGQVVEFFDQDFRELYAISEKMDLYKEFHVSPPAPDKTATLRSKSGSRRPSIVTTSRFQVSLGDSRKTNIKIPAHKLYNPKYLLAMGDVARPTGSLQERGPKRGSILAVTPEEMEPGTLRQANSEKIERFSPLPSDAPSEIFNMPNGTKQDKKGWSMLKTRFSKGESTSELSVNSVTGETDPPPTDTNGTEEDEDVCQVPVRSPSKWKKKLHKLGRRTTSEQTVHTAPDAESINSRSKGKSPCKVS